MVDFNKHLKRDYFDKHQLDAYNKLVAENGGIVWMRVGDGKTRIALKAAETIAKNDNYPLIIIIARRAAFYDWKQEIATLQMNAVIYEIDDTPIEHLPCITIKNDYQIFLLVSDGMIAKDKTQEYILQLINTKSLACIIVDELWLYKNPKSAKHKALTEFTSEHPTIGISGSIMTARDIVDIYGQVAAVGRGKALAKNLSAFRQFFQTGIAGQFMSWYPKPGAYKSMMEKIAPFTYIYFPLKQIRQAKDIIIKVQPTQQQLDLLKELKETAAIEGKFELTNMANLITKAQQISNGWLKAEGGDVENFVSTKVDRLVALVEEILQEEETNKLVIWCAFREDINRLHRRLETTFPKIGIATLQSGREFDTKLWGRKDCRICIATEASGTSINHFAQVPFGIYFSQDFKWTSLQQSQGRHTRRSSLHDTAYFYFLHTEKSLDAQVFYTVKTAVSSEKSFIKQMDVLQWVKGK